METPEPASKGKQVRSLLIIAVLVAALIAVWSNDEDGDSADTEAASLETRSVTIYLTGSASGADLTWSVGARMSQATGRSVPLTRQDGTEGIEFTVAAGTRVSFSAQNVGPTGGLTCRIDVDGETLIENTSDGGYTIVTCSGSV